LPKAVLFTNLAILNAARLYYLREARSYHAMKISYPQMAPQKLLSQSTAVFAHFLDQVPSSKSNPKDQEQNNRLKKQNTLNTTASLSPIFKSHDDSILIGKAF